MDKTLIMQNIRVTVLMPVYNGGKYLKEGIESILKQSYSDFIFLIINDGSSDDTEKIILSFQDCRILYKKNDQNIGLVATLNKGIDLIETEYIVRMDADDIAVPERLEWQIDFMDKNNDIGVSGGLYEIFGNEKGIPVIPLDNDSIKANLLFNNVICHPTVIIRNDILKKNKIYFGVPFSYHDNQNHKILELEDYAIWHKLRPLTRFANIDRVLIKYRREGQNLTSQRVDLIMERKKIFYSYLLKELNIEPADSDLLNHISISSISKVKTPQEIFFFKQYLDLILSNNIKNNVYPQIALENVILEKWKEVFYYLPPLGIKYVIKYWISDKKIKYPHLMYFLKYKINSLIRRVKFV